MLDEMMAPDDMLAAGQQLWRFPLQTSVQQCILSAWSMHLSPHSDWHPFARGACRRDRSGSDCL
jgi:hypothetical protein